MECCKRITKLWSAVDLVGIFSLEMVLSLKL